MDRKDGAGAGTDYWTELQLSTVHISPQIPASITTWHIHTYFTLLDNIVGKVWVIFHVLYTRFSRKLDLEYAPCINMMSVSV